MTPISADRPLLSSHAPFPLVFLLCPITISVIPILILPNPSPCMPSCVVVRPSFEVSETIYNRGRVRTAYNVRHEAYHY